MSTTDPAAPVSAQRMDTTQGSAADGSPALPQDRSGFAVGVVACAGVLMVMAGAFQALQGLVALFNDTFYVVGTEYVFEFDVTAWGWIHLAVGILVAVAGAALFGGAVWARTVAVVLAGLSMFANFLWIPYYPIWSLVIIAFNVFVIWAVTVHGRDIVAASPNAR